MIILIPVYRYARFIWTTYNFKYCIKFYSNQYYSVAYIQCTECDTCYNFKLRILYVTFKIKLG